MTHARLVALLLVCASAWAAAEETHWAFRPLRDPTPPQLSDRSRVRNDVDRFVGGRLERSGLRFQAEASRHVLIRRLSFDLVGLPPSPEEVDAFVGDPEPEAYEKLVDRLLASPGHGERWAQHWLDLARFAETDGFEHDKVRPHAWRYRDWVVRAIAHDVPFDEMIQLQIAGDEIRPEDPEAWIATGFALAGPDMPDINLLEERRHMVLNEMLSTVGAVFLGLQIGCAQCHDHKFDPISMVEFYRMRAIFEPALTFADVELPKGGEKARVLVETDAEAPASYVYERGDFRRPTERIRAGFPRAINPGGLEIEDGSAATSPTGSRSSGRRRAFARWLTRETRFLSTRVAVNRVWRHHFTVGLVETPNDFGRKGDRPSHPGLLDALSLRFEREGWGLKRLHRTLVSSTTYRQASTRPSEAEGARAFDRALELDPENRLLARGPRRRLEAEALRDALLGVGGLLDRCSGGPGVYPPLPPEVQATLLKGQWPTKTDLASTARRSVYVFARRNLRYPFFEMFDRPDADTSCARRTRSTTAPQALTLLHSELVVESARGLASWALEISRGDPARSVDLLYRRALARKPDALERRLAGEYLRAASERAARRGGELLLPEPLVEGVPRARAAALTELALVVLNLSEFLWID